MKNKGDRLIEKILNRQHNNRICTIPRATTLVMVKHEAVRRSREDGFDRVIYTGVGADIKIRLAGEDEEKQVTELCYVRHDGKVINID
jgi:hypothetical protein